MSQVTKKDFAEWACSLSGCDGGNPQADIWLCGIEWGYDSRDASIDNYYKNELPQQIAKGADTQKNDKYDWDASLKYTYGWNFAKLYAAIYGGKVENYKTIQNDFNLTGQELFRLNLYPIAFNETNDELWHTYDLIRWTGIKEKSLYRTWCFLHRFPFFAEMVRIHNPKCIICTGTGSLTDFLACFAGFRGLASDINVGNIGNGKRKYYWAKLNNGTVIVIIPFLSRYHGLNSNDLLQEMGEIIGRLIGTVKPE